MKDFEEFRVEAFNNILPLVKEIVDVFFEVGTLKSTLEKYNKKLEKLKKEKEALEKISAINDMFSNDTRFEISRILEKKEKEITDTEGLIEEKENEIYELEDIIHDYNNYFSGVGAGILSDEEKLLKNAEDVKVENLREYCYLMFFLRGKTLNSYLIYFSKENLLSKEAIEYICKCLLENEEENVANRKIAFLRDDKTIHYQEEFFELFK